MPNRPVVIDAGHGGLAPAGRSSPIGVRGPRGALEKDVVLALARSVANHLGAGAAVLTRNDDVNLSLGERAEVARRFGAPVFVSLHANQGSGPGTEAFIHTRAGADSRALAGALQAELAAFGGGRALSVATADLAVLTPERLGPSAAACLLEVDHLTDPQGEQRLREPQSIDRLGSSIARGIRRYMGRPAVHDKGLLEPTVVVGIVGVGVAVFSLINAIEARTVGGLTWRRNISRCLHTYPEGVSPGPWDPERRETVLNIECNSGMSSASAYFALCYRINGNDVDQCRVDKYSSSDWTISRLDVTFEGQDAVSYESNSVGAIMTYLTGTLDPSGAGDIDFSGRVLVKADGTVQAQDSLMVTRGDPSDFDIGRLDTGAGFYLRKR